MTYKSLLPSLVALFLFVGCAPVYTINLATHDVSTFELVDKRSQGDKETSYGRLEDKYGIAKFGDSLFVPDRLALLKSLLDDHYGQALVGKRIEVIQLRTLVYRAPQTNLDAIINSAYGLQVYPGIPDPRKNWWLFEIVITMDGTTYVKNIPEETPDVKFCRSCYEEIRSRATVDALNEFVADFGKKTGLRK